MKTSIVKMLGALVISLLCLKSTAQEKKNFIISGSLTNMASMPSKIYLNYDLVTKMQPDSSEVKDGKYSFKGNIEASSPAILAFVKGAKIADDKNQYALMLDKGLVNILSDGNLANATVTGPGAAADIEYHELTSFARRESAEISKIAQSAEYQTSDSLKKAVQERSTNLLGNALTKVIAYIRKNPGSPSSPYFTYGMIASGFLTPGMTDTLNRGFPAALRTSKIGIAIDSALKARKAAQQEAQQAAAKEQQKLDALVPVGSKAKDFTQNDVEGKPVSLSSFKGKYVLVDFWASWCKPCREENPNVVNAFNKYKEKGFTILGVSFDNKNGKDAWIAAIKSDGLAWTQISALSGFNNEAAVLYGVKSIPQNVLLDPDGIIIAKNLRGEELQQKLDSIFSKKK